MKRHATWQANCRIQVFSGTMGRPTVIEILMYACHTSIELNDVYYTLTSRL